MLKQGSLATGIILTTLVAFGPMSTDLYLPSLPAMVADFGTTVDKAQATLSMFIVGFAAAPLVIGPLSDRFGRRPVLIAGVAIYFLASIACAMAQTIDQLIWFRFLQGMGASVGPVLGRAIVRDLFDRQQAARVMSFMASAMALAPAVAPILGGQLQAAFGWWSNFLALAVFGAIVLGLALLAVQETNPHIDTSALRLSRIADNMYGLLRDRRFLGYSAVVATSFAGLFSFISGSSFVLIDVIGISEEWFGPCFTIGVLGFVTGSFTAGKLTHKFSVNQLIGFGSSLGAVAGVILAGLAWSGVQTLWSVMLPMPFIFFATAFCVPPATAAAIAPFPEKAGSASALMGFIQLGTGAFVGYLVGAFHDHSARPMTSAIALMFVICAAAFWGLVARTRNAEA
ncbi:MAG: multidrug effflux MFS transporter [Magnetospiraceae bacterium]